MNYILTRIDNNNCYLRGILTESGKFICDTLEFGNVNRLKCGLYNIKITIKNSFNPYSYREIITENQKVIQLYDDFKNMLSEINNRTDQIYMNIRIRVNNSNILCCIMSADYQIRMKESINSLLIQNILKDESLGLKSTLEIIEPPYIKDTIKEIECVTEY
jgi:hypothetical protein